MSSASAGWNTIESDAGVFTYLIEKLGVKGVQFEELLSLDPESIQELSPVYGVIFLFKYPTDASSSQPTRQAGEPEAPLDGTYDHAAADSLFFAAQVIQNACGTQALLSLLLNKLDAAPDASQPQPTDLGPHLTAFKEFTQPLPPSIRGEALSNSELIRGAHNAFARASPFVDETARAHAGADDDVYHFIAYTPVGGTLWELDGLQPAPISHGACASDTADPAAAAEFATKIIPVLERRIARYPATEIRFNLLACCADLRAAARARGDWDALEREEGKRRAWVWENALRRHNFLGFAAEVLKGVARAKLAEGTGEGEGGGAAFDAWVQDAVARTKAKIERQHAGAGAGAGTEGQMDVDV